MACLEASAGCRNREWHDLDQMPLLESVSGMLWGSQAKTRIVNSNHKEHSLGNLHRSLI